MTDPIPDLAPAAELDLRRLLTTIWRRKTLIIASVVLVTGLTWIFVSQIPPLYTATSQIVIESRERQFTDIEEVLSGISTDRASIQAELEVLKSRPLAEKVIRKLGLATHEEFNPKPGSGFSIGAIVASVKDALVPDAWLDALRGTRGDIVASEEERLTARRVVIVDNFLGRLKAQSIGFSTVIAISFTAHDPRLAQQATNALAMSYVTNTLEVKFEAAQQATSWLSGRLATLREDVQRSERAVERYRKSVGLIASGASSLVLEQTSQLSSQLVLAQSETAQAAARLRQAERLQGRAGSTESISEVLNSSLIQSHKQQQAGLEREAAELATEYGEKHPRMVNIRAEIRDLGETIQTEVGRITSSLRNDLRVARAKEQALSANLDKLKAEASTLKESEVEMRALDREAEANRLLLENFLTRFKETSAQQGIQQPDARVISRAEVPRAPTSPRTGMILTVAFVFSVALGIGLIFLVEQLDAGFRTSEQLESLTGYPVLGVVPKLSGRGLRMLALGRLSGEPVEDYVLPHPNSHYTEALRSIHLSLMWSHADQAPKLVTITSSLPGEGKSSLAMALARVRRAAGDRVLLLDCDFRRPRIANALGLKEEPGLSDYVFGRAGLDDVIQHDPETGCDVICHGHNLTDPSAAVQGLGISKILNDFRVQYDLIIVDTSPLLAASEARLLAKLSDATIMLVHWGRTPRDTVQAALHLLRDIDVPVIGIVLNQVDIRRHASYGYGQYGYTYGQIKKYYHD